MLRLVAFGAVMLLSGCALLSSAAQCRQGMPLQPTRAWDARFERVDVVRQQYAGASQQLLMAVRQAPEGLTIQGLNTLGLELFRLEYSAGTPLVESAGDWGGPAEFAVLVADFQLVNWPLPLLASRLKPGPWRLAQEGAVRRLSCGGRLVAEVVYPAPGQVDRTIHLSHRIAGYTLAIRRLDSADPAPTNHD